VHLPQGALGSASPSARWGHAAASVDGDRKVLLYGGKDAEDRVRGDTWCLDLESEGGQQWACKVQDSHSGGMGSGAPRAWHAMVAIPERSMLVAIGRVDRGAAEEEGSSSSSSSATAVASSAAASSSEVDMDTFDTSIDLWYPPVSNGKAPSRRTGTAAALMPQGVLPGASSAQRTPEPMLVVFGGLANRGAHEVSGAGASRACLPPFSFLTHTHTFLPSPPSRAQNHVNDVHVWTLRGASKWVNFRTIEGRAPMPRCYHSVIAIGSKLLVFGGNDGVQSFGDLAYLECTPTVSAPDTWSWHWPVALGKGPSARTGASAIALGERYVLISGGWDPHAPARSAAAAAKAAKGGAGGKAGAERGGGKKRNSKGEVVGGEAAAASAAPASAAAVAASVQHPAHALALAAAASLRLMRVAEEEGEVEEPFPEAWLLDTYTWEWLRVAGEVGSASSEEAASAAPAAVEALRCAAGRAGHACVLLQDARPLLRQAAGAATECPGASQALAGGGSSPLPALLLHGGLKADGQRHGDCSLLLLPAALLGQRAAQRAAELEEDIPCAQ
jgi:hypothetical protein